MGRAMRIMAAAMCLAAVPATAGADENTATGAGSIGAVDITVGQSSAHADPIAACVADTTPSNRTDPVTIGNTTKYGLGTTTCKRNADGTVSVAASGERFQTSVLQQFGGPLISVRTFKAGCDTTKNGSSGHMELGNVSGFTVPANIPPNYSTTIPGKHAGDPPMAEIVLNELTVPNPPDGSLVTNAVHIKLYPQGGPAAGDILVGSATCAPFGNLGG